VLRDGNTCLNLAQFSLALAIDAKVFAVMCFTEVLQNRLSDVEVLGKCVTFFVFQRCKMAGQVAQIISHTGRLRMLSVRSGLSVLVQRKRWIFISSQ